MYRNIGWVNINRHLEVEEKLQIKLKKKKESFFLNENT